jgi:hypothetical protein
MDDSQFIEFLQGEMGKNFQNENGTMPEMTAIDLTGAAAHFKLAT